MKKIDLCIGSLRQFGDSVFRNAEEMADSDPVSTNERVLPSKACNMRQAKLLESSLSEARNPIRQHRSIQFNDELTFNNLKERIKWYLLTTAAQQIVESGKFEQVRHFGDGRHDRRQGISEFNSGPDLFMASF